MDKTSGCQYIQDIGQFLEDRVKSNDCGEMIGIIRHNEAGITWRSSRQAEWFMPNSSIQSLLRNWDGASGVYWFWDGTFIDNTEARCVVFVPSGIMAQIKQLMI